MFREDSRVEVAVHVESIMLANYGCAGRGGQRSTTLEPLDWIPSHGDQISPGRNWDGHLSTLAFRATYHAG